MPRSTQFPPSHLLDKHAAAKLIDATPRRLGDAGWRRRYHVPAIRVGGSLRFDPAELLRWLEQRREKTDGGEAA